MYAIRSYYGLVFRSYLSRLNLLLVARISAVIITVVAIIGLFSILSYRLGLTEGLKITFFPMIILSWTIERMSILWEEEGPHQVLIQGGGSLLVAVFAYLAMDNSYVRHLAFNFIGLHRITSYNVCYTKLLRTCPCRSRRRPGSSCRRRPGWRRRPSGPC